MNFAKLATGLSGVIGKTIARIFLVKHRTGCEQMYVVFTDGTHYEFFGVENMTGGRKVNARGSKDIRESLERSNTEQTIEIPPEVA
jgi:hypothetical protein